MKEEFCRQMELPAISELQFEERFGLLMEAEWRERYNNRINRLLNAAKLRCPSACLEDVDHDAGRHLAGAAVDVFEMEPPVPQDHVLLNAKNLIAILDSKSTVDIIL